ncbi:MAG: efflux RND transporter periplasmic adaptor subunit [Thermodesulfobacteriota bacterium]|nr:efflux RND transporter periplasmic adaptor subunit [Thermodesulfobacteriota bacterium]
MKTKKIVLALVIVLAAFALVYYFGYYRPNSVRSGILASGQVEVTEVDLSFRIPGHVARLLVEEGSQVKKGEPLAELKQTVLLARRDRAGAGVKELEARLASLDLGIRIKEELLEAEVNRARAGVSAARARYRSLKKGSRVEEINEAAAARDRAQTEFVNRQKDFERMSNLYERRIISASQHDDARTALEAARAVFEAARERYNLVKAGPRQETVREGRANLYGSDAALSAAKAARREVEKMKLDRKGLMAQAEQTRVMLALAEDDLAESRLFAPFDGFVTIKNVEEQEFVQAGTPVLTLAHLDRVWVKTYVPETGLGRLRLGQKAEITTDSFPDKTYPGTVTYISPLAEFTPKNVQTREERVKLVYRIKVSLDNPNQELKAGMPVDVLLR